jgi:hypothetical protein
MSGLTPPAPGAPPRTSGDPRGDPVAYDGAAPVTWRVGAHVLAERGGRVLVIGSLQRGRWEQWELPGGIRHVQLADAMRPGPAVEQALEAPSARAARSTG